MEILKGIGILMALYGLYGMAKGEVYAKDRITARWYFRDEEPWTFWSTCIGYVVVGIIVVVAISNRLG